MTILLAVLSIIGTSLAFHRAAEWWSRREEMRPRFSSAAVAWSSTWDLDRGTGVKELLDGYHPDAQDAAVVQRGRAAAWDVEGARIVNGRIENQLRANGYFPTPIDPLHTEPRTIADCHTTEEATRFIDQLYGPTTAEKKWAHVLRRLP